MITKPRPTSSELAVSSINQQSLGAKLSIVLAVIAFVVPIALACSYINANGVEVPHADEWVFIAWYQQLCTGKLDLLQIISIENSEHRCLIPYLLMSAITQVVPYSSVGLMYSNLFCLVAICVVFAAIVWRRAVNFGFSPWLAVPISWFFLCFKQYESMLWGTCFIIGVTMLLLVTAFFLLDRSYERNVYFVGGVVAAICTTFANALGLLIWPFGMIQLIAHAAIANKQRPQRVSLFQLALKPAIWAVFASLTVAVYYGLPRGIHPKHDSLTLLKADPLAAIQYFLAFLANPLATEATTAVAIGLLLSGVGVSFLAGLRKSTLETKRMMVLPAVLLLFGFGAACIISYARFDGYVGHALTSRYFAIAAVPIVGVYLACITICKEGGWFNLMRLGMVLSLMIVAAIAGDMWGQAEGQKVREERKVLANMFRYHENQNPAAVKELTIEQEAWRDRIALLETTHASVFRDTKTLNLAELKPIPLEGAFMLEYVNSNSVFNNPLWKVLEVNTTKEKTLIFKGFALSFATRKPAKGVFISIDGSIDVPATMGGARPQIARLYRKSGFTDCGYVACYDATRLSKGLHTVSIKVCTDGKNYFTYGPLAKIDLK